MSDSNSAAPAAAAAPPGAAPAAAPGTGAPPQPAVVDPRLKPDPRDVDLRPGVAVRATGRAGWKGGVGLWLDWLWVGGLAELAGCGWAGLAEMAGCG